MKKEKLPIIQEYDHRVFPMDRAHWAVHPYDHYERDVIAGTKDRFYHAHTTYRVNCYTDKPFYQKVSETVWGYKNGKIWIKSGVIHRDALQRLLDYFGKEWATKDYTIRFLLKYYKEFLPKVFSGAITNEKDLYLAFSRKYFKGVYYAGALKDFLQYGTNNFSVLWDVAAFCTDPNYALGLIAHPYGEIDPSTLCDAIHYAKFLNQKINPRWSSRRMREEHQKQIEALGALKAETYDATPIVEKPYTGRDIELILDEKTCALWADYMHNCMYRCYWSSAKDGRILLAKGFINEEDVAIEIRFKDDGRITLPQVLGKYNGHLKRDTLDMVVDWAEQYKDTLDNTLKAIIDKNDAKLLNNSNLVDPIIPLPW